MECPLPQIEQGPVLLVVDDRMENLLAMQAVLEVGNWRVITAASGERALQYLLDETVDLVLLDVQMPIMDGFEVARIMRSNLRTRFTPIIFVSAEAHSYESVLRGYATGAVDYLLKPVDPNILRHKVRSLLDHERNRRELLQATQQLELAKSFSDSLLDNAAEGILTVNEQGRVTFANAAIARMLRCSVSDLVHANFLDFLEGGSGLDDWQTSPFMEHYDRRETYRLHDARLRTSRGDFLPGGAVLRALAAHAARHGHHRPGHVAHARTAGPTGIPGRHRRPDRSAQPPRFQPDAGGGAGTHRA
ncbi:DNA-binding response OmpR family regulator [Pseudomonas psychrotolerans]|nr:DNA-binding response OmpR family regulator [Pseudomonas psychrotolerans]